MEKTIIKLGYCPTRRDVFDRNSAIEYSKLIKDHISQYDIEIVDIDGITAKTCFMRIKILKQLLIDFAKQMLMPFSFHTAISVLKTELLKWQNH